MHPQVLFQNRRPDRSATLEEYRQGGGYTALETAVLRRSPAEVRVCVEEAMLVGRGGAAFPTGRKWAAVADNAPFPRYVVANADEMEPGTFKDRALIDADPHEILEGMILTGYAIRSERGYLFIRPSYGPSAELLEREIENARAAGLLGRNILGSGFSFDLVVHRSAGRYICGEATALLNALQGKRPNPWQPPPYPTDRGLWGKPTVVNNVETFACVPHILRNGTEWFRNLSRTPSGAGTKIYCVSGKVKRPGSFELPMGTPLNELIEEHAGGLPAGLKFKTCLPGGSSTRYLPAHLYTISLDYESFRKAGHRLGTGAVIVFDQTTCLVAATLNIIRFFARESCGWCTPCREGLPCIEDLLARIEHGEGRQEFIPKLRVMSEYLWKSYCAFAPGAVSSVESMLTYFADEVMEHITQHKCPFPARGRVSLQESGRGRPQ